MIDRIAKFQLILFFISYSVWVLPETNFLKDICLISGAIISLFIIYSSREYLFHKNITPFSLIMLLIVWVIIHFIFFSRNHLAELNDLSSIWKRAFIAAIFGLGFGLFFCRLKNKASVMKFLYLAITMPVIIYYFKLLIGSMAIHLNFNVPDFVRIFDTRISAHYIPKPEYLLFIFPALLFSLLNIYKYFIGEKKITKFELFNYLIIFLVFGLFYFQKIKSGFFYGAVALIIYTIFFIKNIVLTRKEKLAVVKSNYAPNFRMLIVCTSLIVLASTIFLHFQSSKTWQSFYDDLVIGMQIDRFEHWKYLDREDNPLNAQGAVVSRTTYDRAAWAVAGFRLLVENPLGYGVLEQSFHFLAREKWPASKVPQSHNSWIDFGLAFGWPGIACLFFAILLLITNHFHGRKGSDVEPIELYIIVVLLSYATILLTSEVNFKYALPITFFWVAFLSGVQLHLARPNIGCCQ